MSLSPGWSYRVRIVSIFALSVAVMVRPSPSQLSGSIPNLSDPAFVTYLLRWGAHSARTNPLGYLSPTFYWPTPHVLALSDPVTPLVPVYSFFYLLTRSLATALTLTAVSMLLLNLLATFALARFLGSGTVPSVVAALGFGYSGYVTSQWGHVQLQSLGLIPLGLLFLSRVLVRPRVRDALAFGVASALLAMCSLYYGAIYAIVTVFIVLGWCLLQPHRVTRRLVGGLGLGAAVSVVLLAPLLPAYVGSKAQLHTHRPIIAHSGLTVYDLVRPAGGSLVHGALARALPGRGFEHQTFPGGVLYLLAIGGFCTLLPRRSSILQTLTARPGSPSAADSRRLLILISAGGLVALSVAAGSSIGGLPGPFVFLHDHVPGFDGIRVPARFVVMWLLAVALLAARGMDELYRLPPRTPAHLLLVALPLCVLAENAVRLPWQHLPLAPVQSGVYRVLASKPPGAAIELPMAKPSTHDWDAVEPLRMLYSSVDWHPRVNGYAGYVTPGYVKTYATQRSFPDRTALDRLHLLGVRWVVLHIQATTGRAGYSTRDAEAIVRRLPKGTPVERATDALLVDLHP